MKTYLLQYLSEAGNQESESDGQGRVIRVTLTSHRSDFLYHAASCPSKHPFMFVSSLPALLALIVQPCSITRIVFTALANGESRINVEYSMAANRIESCDCESLSAVRNVGKVFSAAASASAAAAKFHCLVCVTVRAFAAAESRCDPNTLNLKGKESQASASQSFFFSLHFAL